MRDIVTLRDGLLASAEGRRISGWANAVTPGTTLATVLATAGLVTTLQPGQKVFITQYRCGVETVSDNCKFVLGWQDANNVFRAIDSQVTIHTSAALAGDTSFSRDLIPPVMLSYAAGVRSISFMVTANDTGCQVTVGYSGWLEKE